MKIRVNANTYSTHFADLLETQKRYVICFGGRGSGKTHHIILKLLITSFLKDYNHILYVNKEFRHIKSQQYSDIRKICKMYNLEQYFTFYNGDYRIVNNITGTKFTPIGMDDAEKTKGISDPTIIWWDEINKGTKEDFTTLNALLRTPLNNKHQFIISFNPVSDKHWLRTYFFSDEDFYKLNSEFSNITYLNHSTYINNDFINKDEYLSNLKLNALGNINRMLVDIDGKWGIETNDNPFFYALSDRNLCDSKYTLNYNQMCYLSFDFNKSPTTLVIGTFRDNEFAIIDCILTNEHTRSNLSPLEACCTIFYEKYIMSGILHQANLIITGDASGASGGSDKKLNENFYTKIQEILKVNKYQIRKRKSNISHQLSQEICNSFIYNVGLKIYKSAEIVYNDMNEAQIIGGKLVKNNDYGLHITDAVRYMLDCAMDFDKWQNKIIYYKNIKKDKNK